MDRTTSGTPAYPVFKPTIPPVSLFIVDLAIMIGGQSQVPLWLLGIVLGIAGAWMFAAIVSVRVNIAKRWPKLLDWFPFLKPPQHRMVLEELRFAKYIRGQSFRLVDVCEGNRISGKTFEDCVILGPAVIAPSGFTLLHDCTQITREIGGNAWPLDPASAPGTWLVRDGAVLCENCRFLHCQFDGIGFANPKENLMKNVTLIDGDTGKPIPAEAGARPSPEPVS